MPNLDSSCDLDLSIDDALQDLSFSAFQDLSFSAMTPQNEDDVTEMEKESEYSSIPSPPISNFSSNPSIPSSSAPIHEQTHKNSESLDYSKSTFGVKLVFDNIDKNIVPRNMTFEKQTKSLHYVHMYAVEDRINIAHLSDDPPDRMTPVPIAEVFKTILPSPNDNEIMATYFSKLVSRVLATHMPFFKLTFADVVEWHTEHQFSQEMAKESVVVS